MLAAAAIALGGLGLFATRTRTGIAWRATVTNPGMAIAFGVDVVKVRYLNFLIGSALAALAGALIALLNNFVEPSMGFVVSYKALAIIVLGGLGSVPGTLIASLALGIIESYATIFVGSYLDRDAIALPLPHCRLDRAAARLRRGDGGMSAYAVSLLSFIGLNIMLAVSLNLISGFCGQFSLGHGAFYGAGAYATAYAATAGAPLVPALLAGASAAASLGIVVGFAALRLREDFLAVTTIGLSFLFVGFVRKQHWLGAEMGLSKIPPSGIGPAGNAILIMALAVATIVFSLYVKRSWMGFAFRAVGDDEDTARTIGINASSFKLAAFAIGTAIAGLAGGLYAFFTQFVVPDSFGFIVSVTLMAMVVIGGTGSTWGVVAGAVLLTLLPEAFRFVNEFRLLIFGGLLVVVMRFAPGGLAGIVRRMGWAR